MFLWSVLDNNLALLSPALTAGKGVTSITPLSVLGKTFVLPSVPYACNPVLLRSQS